MIGCSKLICGQVTISDIMRHGREISNMPAKLMQFSSVSSPLVVWNMTRRCNLKCLHCYITAEDKNYSGELTLTQAKTMIDDLAKIKIPVLLFSGGEPLLRKDIFELGSYADSNGIRIVLSSNGTLITPEIAAKIKEAGFQYVGVSIDGTETTHDHFRQKKGAFAEAITGIQNCVEAGIKAGARLTINEHNYESLAEVMAIVEKENILRFCMYHLVYAGRGKEIAKDDISKEQSRKVIEMLVDKVIDWRDRGISVEILTTDNHADGVYILKYIKKNQPERLAEVKELLEMHGGCSAGTKMANIDYLGNVHPCQFWGHVTLGNVKEKPFSQIWSDPDNEFLKDLRQLRKKIKGRCGQCLYKNICGGCRIRASTTPGGRPCSEACPG